jgi:hypothetical protein
MQKIKISLLFLTLLFINSCSTSGVITLQSEFDYCNSNFASQLDAIKNDFKLSRFVKLNNVLLDSVDKTITVQFSKELASLPVREGFTANLKNTIKKYFTGSFSDYDLVVTSMGYNIDELIPNFYRTDKDKTDKNRLPGSVKERIPVVQNNSKPFKIVKGLNNKNILLWHSHGWYYNNNEKRWMWQRARLFQTIEDLGPLSFTIPYLIPMLENAGANVFVPRERDIQTYEVIVDNDNSSKESYIESSVNDESQWKTSSEKGFALKSPVIKEGENPFNNGTARYVSSMINPFSSVSWIPEIPKTGYYAVYVSYIASDKNVTDANYKVKHSGGETDFRINQTIGGKTWIYLGRFKFEKGRSKNQGVVLTNQSKDVDKIVSADAVRFGGGMGIVEREGTTSGKPKFAEGSRYWMQFAGMPDTLTYNLNNNNNDYNDDYQSRAEYGNYLYGAPFGPNRKRNEKGLGIPIDLSLAFHTDAGITKNDTAIGTLMIYSIPGLDSQNVFPDGVSRLANRDLSDIVQTQIVNDIRKNYDSTWTRRQLMNSMYSEAARPNFPSVLLELLSHQNFYDMKFGLDPSFRFDVARSIYIGMLKFLSVQYGFDYVVQPLPPKNFSAILNNNGEVELSWKAQNDLSEPTAAADKYILYTRINDKGFDNGRLIESDKIKLSDLKEDNIYSYRITAVNNGGESFASEILSVCYNKKSPKPILIVNGFDRVSAPASFDSPDFSGFLNFLDEGVPDKYEYSFTGTQFNFNPDSKWTTDDNPGHGASNSYNEGKVIAGNTFDFVYMHGKSLKENGFSFCSASDESIMSGEVNLSDYKMADILFGEEKKTQAPKYKDKIRFEVFPDLLKQKVKSYIINGGKLFISGSYIGTDLYSDKDSTGIKFAIEVLKLKLKTGWAVKTGKVFSVNEKFLPKNQTIEFNTTFNDSIYKVEAPDELGEINGSEVLMRYSENNFSSVIGYKGDHSIITFGFPFETILGEKNRNTIMKSVLNYLDVK